MGDGQLPLLIAFMVFVLAVMGGLAVLFKGYMKRRSQMPDTRDE
ncbi:MAG: hypothetical protein ACE363_01615 [Alphaproteobacteria bacterium]